MDDFSPAKKLDQPIYRARFPCTQVIDLVLAVRLGGQKERPGDISDKDKVPDLSPVPDHGERSPGKFLSKKDAENRPIGAGGAGPGPVGIKDPKRNHRKQINLSPMQDGMLAQILAQRVGILRTDLRFLRSRKLL